MTGQLLRYAHATPGFSIDLPSDWEMQVDPQPAVAIAVLEQRDDDAFRANLVVTTDDLPDGMDLTIWQAGIEERLPDALNDYYLLDMENVVLDQEPAHRRLAHHITGSGVAVTMQQWSTLCGRRGLSVTTTVDTLELASTAALFNRIVASLSVADDPPARNDEMR